MKLYEYVGNGCSITPLNSPGGSTLQWDAGQDLLSQASRVLSTPLRLSVLH